MTVNTIQVKNENYDIQDLELTRLRDSLITNSDNPKPSANNKVVYSNGETLVNTSFSTVYGLFNATATCHTPGSTQIKSVAMDTLSDTPQDGVTIGIKFDEENTANDIQLKINDKAPNYIIALNSNQKLQAGSLKSNVLYMFTYYSGVWYAHTPVYKEINGTKFFVWG